MEHKFFTFIKPYLSYIDNGHLFTKPFSWLYALIAIVNLLLPINIMYKAYQIRIFDAPAKFVITFMLIWIIIAFVSWVSFQLWWDRRTKMHISNIGNEFVVTPVFSHFIQTLGEWIGTWIGLVGFSFALFVTIFLGADSSLGSELGIPYLSAGIANIIIMPIVGFLIIVSSRFLSEQIRAVASIANNTRKR